MTNITSKVNEYLDSNFIITSSLMKNIMSLRALSRYLCQVLDLEEKNLNAVMSAIRRYKKDNKIKEVKTKEGFFKQLGIKTKDKVVDIYIAKNKNSQEKLFKLSNSIDIEKGDIFRVIQAEEGIRIIIDERNLGKAKKIFSDEDIINTRKNLAELVLHFSPAGVKTKGVISIVSSSLTAGNINIVEMMSSAPEIIIIVDNNDLIKGMSILNNLKNLY